VGVVLLELALAAEALSTGPRMAFAAIVPLMVPPVLLAIYVRNPRWTPRARAMRRLAAESGGTYEERFEPPRTISRPLSPDGPTPKLAGQLDPAEPAGPPLHLGNRVEARIGEREVTVFDAWSSSMWPAPPWSTCVAAELSDPVPFVRVVPRGRETARRAPEPRVALRELELGTNEFARSYRVLTSDPEGARAVLEAGVAARLVGADPRARCSLEMGGRWIVAQEAEPSIDQVRALGVALGDIASRVERVRLPDPAAPSAASPAAP
jgi:hypothetical protein